MTRRRTAKRRGRVFLILFALLLLCAGFLYSEQNWIQSETVTVSSPRLPAAFDGLRIVQISDLHGGQFGRDNAALLRAVDALAPDLIVITGDLVDDRPGQMDVVPSLARALATRAPTYYVTGNHEWAAGLARTVKQTLAECGVTVLSNEYVVFERDGERLVLAGVDDPNGLAGQKSPQALTAELRTALGDPFVLLLAHRNNQYQVYDDCGVDLVLAGHAHGGLVRLPFTDGLVGPLHELFPTYTAGLYAFPHTRMFVSRGLGSGAFPQVRLFNRPHLPVIVLKRG